MFNFWILLFKYNTPISKTFKSIFEPYYGMNKMWRWFAYSNSNMRDTKNDWLNIHIYSIMAASDSWNIAFYCGRIFTQSLPNSEIIRSCEDLRPMKNEISLTDISAIMAQIPYKPYKTSRSLVEYCTNWLSNWSNMEKFLADLKKISRSFEERTDSLF